MKGNGKPIGIGIIGCGNVLEAYAPACEHLRQRGWARWIIACGRNSQSERARALGAPRFTTNELDVLHSPEIEVVVILASMPEHARLAKAALAAGKHVLVEKPLASTIEEASELLQLAKNSDRLLVAAPFTILSPTFKTLSRRIRRGDIGKPCSARARYGWSGPWWNEWFYRPGGGCLLDLGVYCLTTLTGLLGPVQRVMAMTGIAIPDREVQGRLIRVEAEDNAQVLLDFGQACFGVVTTGFTLQQYRSPALEIYGTAGSLQMLGDDWDPDGYELWQNSVGAWQLFKETAPDWPWTDGLNHLIECLRDGVPLRVTPEHALHVLEIILNANASSRENRAFPIASRFAPPLWEETGPSEAPHRQHDRTRLHL